jgi:hypothetical protein
LVIAGRGTGRLKLYTAVCGEQHDQDGHGVGHGVGHCPTTGQPMRVQVLMGRRWVDATAHGRRNGPHGPQFLVLQGSRFAWIHADLVREHPDRSR